MRLIPYLGVVLLITVTPGPDTALVVRHAVRVGLRPALATALGCAIGLLVWGSAAAVGITVLVVASHTASTVLRVAGSAYLVVLGIGLLRHRGEDTPMHGGGIAGRLAPFTQGLLNNLLNPKAAVFFTALLPQFLPTNGSTLLATLLMALMAAAASMSGLTVYALLAHRARTVFSRRRATLMIDRLTGASLIGIGARLAVARDR